MQYQKQSRDGIKTDILSTLNVRNSSYEISYIIVHPDEYALQNSSIINEPSGFKKKLQNKIKKLIDNHVIVYITSLSENQLEIPEFLIDFYNQINIIPLQSKDKVANQVYKLKRQLITHENLKKIIITGGWKNACLKFSINQLIKPSRKISDIDEIKSPIEIFITYQEQKKRYILEIDHEFVF